MAISTFSLPIDIPWRRIAFSQDMMDKVACDRELPLRWRSSVAIFDYEPPADQQRIENFTVSYLKVSCSITGYQASEKEIRIRERLGRSGWTHKDNNEALQRAVGDYYACYGAMLEVVVAPHDGDERFTLAEYPYFADFDPKKRELYELVTDTGEVMSRSLEDVGVRLGQTTSQSHEVRDSTTISGEVEGSVGVASAKAGISHTASTADISSRATENVRTTDAARENRETFSHTTQLSQMYHQLDSYHIGSNRAMFFLLPRPHTVESPRTFVNGPREIEGVQEFMLVVVRPKAMERFCVEAYLETAHLTHHPVYDKGETIRPLNLKFEAEVLENDDQSVLNPVTKTEVSPTIAGKIVDTDRGAGGWNPAGIAGYDVLQPIDARGPFPPDIEFKVASDHVEVTAKVESLWNLNPPIRYPASIDLHATVYYKNAVPTIVGYTDGLLITGRAVCSCGIERIQVAHDATISIAYEKSIGIGAIRPDRLRGASSVLDANLLQTEIHREMLHSLNSADRYPRGVVNLLDTQMVAGLLGATLRNATPEANRKIVDWPGVQEDLARHVARYVPSMTRAELLEMPLPLQVERFGITFEEAVKLRRSLADLNEPDGPPPVPPRNVVQVPLLVGLTLPTARRLLSDIGLRLGEATILDSPLPAGVIVAHSPAAGEEAAPESTVTLQLASGLTVRLPEVAGLGLTDAVCRLRSAGLRSEPTVEGRAVPEAKVVEISPPSGSLVTPNTSVTLRLKRG
ncbi:MAG: PASTA domain-containing protein [Armatimonas sp.]